MVRYSEVKQTHHCCHHGDTLCHPKSGYVTTTLHERLHVYATIMRSFQTDLFSSFLPSTYAGRVNLAAAKPWQLMPNWKDGSTVELIIFRV